MAEHFASVDDYIASFPEEVRDILQRVRRTIHEAAPEGVAEKISYGIPTVTLDRRNLVHFAGWAHHVSVYPVPEGDAAFQRDTEPYRSGKGTLKFPLKAPVPYDLIARVVGNLVAERH
ncbi:iron chaperone [Streptomyces sp. NPDC000229]|uniref:iron chaperone n=1 Tax=Streptomyces sp. NPDC000229 TaxID=3154247 RepID=UPI00331A187C